MKTYYPGTKAYIDSFSGLIPCTVLTVAQECSGKIVGFKDDLVVRVDKTTGCYIRGESVSFAAHKIVPRAQVKNHKVNTDYCYQPE